MAKLITPLLTKDPDTGRDTYEFTIQDVTPANGSDFTLGELQSFVNGLISIIELGNGQIMIVNDEFLMNDSIYNHLATCLVDEPIYGDVLICASEQVK